MEQILRTTQEIRNLALELAKSGKPIEANSYLPAGFEPTPWSVLCGKGKKCFNHVGNRKLRILIDIYLPRFKCAKSRAEKSVIVSEIADAIRTGAGPSRAGFIKFDTSSELWFEIGDEAAREKITNDLRVAKSSKPKESGHHFAKTRRKQRRSRFIGSFGPQPGNTTMLSVSCLAQPMMAASNTFVAVPHAYQQYQSPFILKPMASNTLEVSNVHSVGQESPTKLACKMFGSERPTTSPTQTDDLYSPIPLRNIVGRDDGCFSILKESERLDFPNIHEWLQDCTEC